MADEPQTYANHAKVVPAYHYFTFGLVAIYFVYRVYLLITAPSLPNGMGVVAATALLLIMFWARLFARKVQDRVIRLEMRVRMARLGLEREFDQLEHRQLIALRFASDPEIPVLARRAIGEKLPPDQIKRAIQHWQGDFYRT